jgi:hypothetical protein
VKNKKGIVLNEIIQKNNYGLAAPDEPTLFPPRGNPSVIDFFIYKNVQVSGTKTINDLSSDHLPVFAEFECDSSPVETNSFNFKKANWRLFKTELDKAIDEMEWPELNSALSIDISIDK